MAQTFQVDTSDYLGYKCEEYFINLKVLSMSKPSDYYDIRADTLNTLKHTVIESVYK